MRTTTISFQQFMNLQARFIQYKSRKLNQSELDVAVQFAPLLRSKIENKYPGGVR